MIFAVTALSAIVVIGGPLFWLFMNERVKHIAREATEKALADYRHKHERDLAEFGLYARQRYRVYPAIYRQVKIAADILEESLSPVLDHNFIDFDRLQAHEYLKSIEAPKSTIVHLLELYDNGSMESALTELEKIARRDRLQRGDGAFKRAMSLYALHRLYLSDEVQQALTKVSVEMGATCTAVNPDLRHASWTVAWARRLVADMHVSVASLYDAMRAELRRV